MPENAAPIQRRDDFSNAWKNGLESFQCLDSAAGVGKSVDLGLAMEGVRIVTGLDACTGPKSACPPQRRGGAKADSVGTSRFATQARHGHRP